MFFEACGVPIPSEVIMPFSGFLVATGGMVLWIVIFAGVLGDLAGAFFAYWIGWRGGRPLIEKYGKYFLISNHDLDIADRWFKRYGEVTVFLAAFCRLSGPIFLFQPGLQKWI